MSNALAVAAPSGIAGMDEKRQAALIKAVGWDRVPAEQRELALAICQRYDLDPMLRHVVMIEGKPYITRDGLLWVAHRSGVFDGIEVTDPVLEGGYWKCRAKVYRKDMSRPFDYPGRYPDAGRNLYKVEMAIKVAEVMGLRRAFNVAAPVFEERWDLDLPSEQQPASTPRPVVPLAERAAARRAEVEARASDAAASSPQPAGEGGTSPAVHDRAGAVPPGVPHLPSVGVEGSAAPGGPRSAAQPDEPDLLPASSEVEPVVPSGAAPSEATKPDQCESTSDPAMPPVERCRLFAGHKGVHRAQGISWPNP